MPPPDPDLRTENGLSPTPSPSLAKDEPQSRCALVTGATGFVGAHLVEGLLNRGWRVVAVGRRERAEDLREPDAWLRLSYLDLPVEALAGVDVLFHQAALNDTLETDEARVHEVNVRGSRRLFEAALAQGCGRIVYASSMAVYGDAPVPLREDGPARPLNAYGRSKLAMEQMALELAAGTSGQGGRAPVVVGLRYGNVYGCHEEHKGAMASMVTRLAHQMREGDPTLFADGFQRRDFVHVDDVVRANLLAVDAPRSTVVNVGSGTAVRFNELVALLNRVLGTERRPRYDKNPHADCYQTEVVLDLARARRELGYEPAVTLEEGLDRCFAFAKL